MALNVVKCFPKKVIDFGASGASQEIILADRMSLLAWREATLQLRVHSHSLAGHLNSISVNAYGQSISAEDPGLTFLETSSIASVLISPSTASGTLFNLDLGSDGSLYFAPPLVRITAAYTRADSGTIAATLSADLSLKNR
jgi:hypothetical protein